jgi:hypothetical protein
MPKDLEKLAVSVTVEEMAGRLVEAEIRESRVKRPIAQREISRRAGIAPTAVENFQRGRLKHVERISGKIQGLYVAFLKRQLAALQTEYVRAQAIDPERDLRTAEAAIAQARAALGK